METTKFDATTAAWTRRGFLAGGSALAAFLLMWAITACVEFLDASHVMVIQYPNGKLAALTEPGPQQQWFGTVTKYPRRETYDFSNAASCTRKTSGGAAPFKVQFNDGGFGFICGSLQWEIPTQPELLLRLQKEYGSHAAIDQQLVARVMENAIYFSGPTMSSIESAGERRAELLQYIDDQARNGVYQVQTRQEKRKDVTGLDRTFNVVEIVRDKQGLPLRTAKSPIAEYGIKIVQLSISEISYDDAVKKQIGERQLSINQVQLAVAAATKAEQDAKTAAEKGKANAAEAEWKQKTVAAQAIELARQEKTVAETNAQRQKEVAKLERDAAEFTKQRDILLGQGESEKRRLLLVADGALTQKLEAYKEVQAKYAEAIGGYAGNWVPQVVMGNQGGGSTNGALSLIEMLSAKTARDLALDLGVKK